MGLPRSYLSSTDAGWAATSSWEAQEDKNVFPRIASLQAKWKCWSSRGPGRRASLQRPRPSDFDRLQDTGARRRSMANSTTHVFRRRASYHASCCTMHGSQRTPFHGSVADDPSEIRGACACPRVQGRWSIMPRPTRGHSLRPSAPGQAPRAHQTRELLKESKGSATVLVLLSWTRDCPHRLARGTGGAGSS